MENESIILTTYPNEDEAVRLSRKLVQGRLIACANIFRVKSIYWWKGKVEEHEESMAVMKTRKERFPNVKRAIEREHQYEVPEVIEVRTSRISRKYKQWLLESVS